jgi:hypothetical protein
LIPSLLSIFAVWGSLFLIVYGFEIFIGLENLGKPKSTWKKRNISLKDYVIFILLALFLLLAIFVLKRLGIFHV